MEGIGGTGGLWPPSMHLWHGKHGKGTFSALEMVLLVVLPCLLSLVVYTLFANIYHHSVNSVAGVVSSFALGAALVALRWRAVPAVFFVAVFCLLATIFSTAIGLISYDVAFSHYWFLHDSNSYVNVLATESAAGYADAGKVVFADGTRIDAGRALGYKDGKTYCVAPIMDEMTNGAAEFWAVGIDCCSVRGSFWCDDAWSPKARSGIVVQDRTEDFSAAVREAEAAFEIAASVKPLLVRWVVDPEQVQQNYHLVGVAVLISAFLVQLLLLALGTLGVNAAMTGLENLFR